MSETTPDVARLTSGLPGGAPPKQTTPITMADASSHTSPTLVAPPNELNGTQPRASLYVLLRDGGAFEYELTKPETTLGKSGQNDVVLTDAAVSSAHAQIKLADGHFTLTDLGSRNGTFLNDTRLTETRPLNHGDLIKMGHCTLTFRLEEAGSTLSMGRTELLGVTMPPPAPAPPPVPKPAAITEEVLAAALASSGLVAQAELDRIRAEKNPDQRLAATLLEKKLVTEIGLRDLMSRTFNLAPVDVKTMEIDAATAVSVGAESLRKQFIFPAVSQQSDKLLLVVADPTNRLAIEEVERKMRRRSALKLAPPAEIVAQLDAFFLPRLIGVLPTGEKIEALLNQPEIEIGKAAHNRLVINDPTVSSTHAILIVRDGGYSIADLGSSNGTFINGAKLGNEAHTLQHGDKVQLGQVVLTFRNPAETTENKTARLSLEDLEKARQRAMTRSLQTPLAAKTDPNTWDQPVAPPAPTPAEQAAEEEREREKKEKKKKEKEKKEGERMRAAWVGGISRIVAQVLGVLLTVGLTLYLIRPGGGGGTTSQQPPVVGTGKAAPLLPVKSWNDVSTGLFGSKIEPSGAAYVPNSDGVLLVSDNRESEVVWMQLDEKGKQVGALKYIQLGMRVRDPESITYGNGYFYLISSQVNPKDTEANSLVRFDFDATTQSMRGTPEVIHNLRSFILTNVTELSSLGAPSGVDGGLNIEGIAWDPNNERLLLGLRSPQIGTQGVVIPLKLRDPRGPFTLDNLRLDEPRVIVLALDGQGVRDITYDPRIKNFLIISGAPETSPKVDFSLWEWTGQPDAKPIKLMTLDDKQKPEGITSANVNGVPFVFVVGDSGGHTKIDYTGAH